MYLARADALPLVRLARPAIARAAFDCRTARFAPVAAAATAAAAAEAVAATAFAASAAAAAAAARVIV